MQLLWHFCWKYYNTTITPEPHDAPQSIFFSIWFLIFFKGRKKLMIGADWMWICLPCRSSESAGAEGTMEDNGWKELSERTGEEKREVPWERSTGMGWQSWEVTEEEEEEEDEGEEDTRWIWDPSESRRQHALNLSLSLGSPRSENDIR